MVLYMAVTCDKFELPLYVSDKRSDMANWCGVDPRTVSVMCARNKHKPPISNGSFPYVRLRRVVIDEKEDEEYDEA